MHAFVRRASFAVVLACALVSGFVQYVALRGTPLDYDADQYLRFASGGILLGTYREPAWMALLMPVVAILGPTDDAIRTLGLLGFAALALAIFFVADRLYGRRWAWLLSGAVIVSPWLRYQAPRGLREEFSAACLILLGWSLVGVCASARRLVLVAGAAALLALLRWDTLMLTLPLWLMAAVRSRAAWRTYVNGGLVAAILVAPLLLANALVFSDPLWHSNIHAGYFQRREFNEPQQPGVRYSWAAYLLGRHSLAELASRAAVGSVEIPLAVATQSAGPFGTPLLVFGVFGAVLSLRGVAWPFGVLTLLSTMQFSLLAPVLVGYDEERLALAFAPLLALCVPTVVDWLARASGYPLAMVRPYGGGWRRRLPDAGEVVGLVMLAVIAAWGVWFGWQAQLGLWWPLNVAYTVAGALVALIATAVGVALLRR